MRWAAFRCEFSIDVYRNIHCVISCPLSPLTAESRFVSGASDKGHRIALFSSITSMCEQLGNSQTRESARRSNAVYISIDINGKFAPEGSQCTPNVTSRMLTMIKFHCSLLGKAYSHWEGNIIPPPPLNKKSCMNPTAYVRMCHEHSIHTEHRSGDHEAFLHTTQYVRTSKVFFRQLQILNHCSHSTIQNHDSLLQFSCYLLPNTYM